jgi:hypothetical protein
VPQDDLELTVRVPGAVIAYDVTTRRVRLCGPRSGMGRFRRFFRIVEDGAYPGYPKIADSAFLRADRSALELTMMAGRFFEAVWSVKGKGTRTTSPKL